MNLNDKIGLKLIGKSENDIKTISAYLQDSVATIKNIVLLKKNRTFLMLVSRFMWEDMEKGDFRTNKRIKCAVKFEEVIKAESLNINQKNKKKILEFLAIKCKSNLNELFEIKVFFSGGGIITLISESIDIILDDFGKPWNVKYIPKHNI